MSDAAPNPARLEYADRPVVGNVVIQRSPDGVTVVLRRGDVRLIQAAILAAAGLVLVALCVVMSWKTKTLATIWWWLILVVSGVFGTAGAAAVAGICPVTVAVDRRHFVNRWRQLLEIRSVQYDRAWVVDVRAARLPRRETVVAAYALEAVIINGDRLPAFMGTRAEAEHAADVLREAMVLPPARWFEAAYPPMPKRTRVTRKMHPVGLVLEVAPPLVPTAFWFAAPFLAAGSLILAPWILQQTSLSRWTLLWSAAYFALGGVATAAVMTRLSTRRTVSVGQDFVQLRETGLRPGHEQWPTDDVEDVAVTEAGRRGAIELLLRGGRRAPLFVGRRKDVEAVAASLRTALELSWTDWPTIERAASQP